MLFGRPLTWEAPKNGIPGRWLLRLASPEVTILVLPSTYPEHHRDMITAQPLQNEMRGIFPHIQRWADEYTVQDVCDSIEDHVFLWHQQLGRLLERAKSTRPKDVIDRVFAED